MAKHTEDGKMKYLSICSGIEAASVAWDGMGWMPVGFSEIEPFPSAVLAHHYPDVTNFGDITTYADWSLGGFDLLVGGTPCQSFSVAGLRKGLDDPRGNLALVYCGMLNHLRPTWFVWENVPGVLSSSGGRDFGSFLGALAKLGYGFAYRVLDAQFFGVAQRRRRVFVVGYIGDWRPPAAVLFERESLRRDTAPSREAGKEIAQCLTTGVGQRYDPETESLIPAQHDMAVRRLTPVECERLQGFSDNYTNIPWRKKDESPDGPRYKALGNSMAVPVMRWIGQRITAVTRIQEAA
jgi:DNA (cytosine-5)-methyltransferase 1